MAWISKTDKDWLEKHGVKKSNGWECKETGADINAIETGRSIHLFGLPGGAGEVRRVLHLYCTRCQVGFEPPAYGTPIQERDLIEVGN